MARHDPETPRRTALTELIEEKVGKGKSDVDSGGGQGRGGDGGVAGSSAVKTFGGGKKAKMGVFVVPYVQDASVQNGKKGEYI